jgi:hypothetical protein
MYLILPFIYIVLLFKSFFSTTIIENNNQGMEKMDQLEKNSILLSCIHISRHFIKNVKREIESTMNSADLSQSKVYDKIFLLLIRHCQNNLKFEETAEVNK